MIGYWSFRNDEKTRVGDRLIQTLAAFGTISTLDLSRFARTTSLLHRLTDACAAKTSRSWKSTALAALIGQRNRERDFRPTGIGDFVGSLIRQTQLIRRYPASD
jgi:hypothetical protein